MPDSPRKARIRPNLALYISAQLALVGVIVLALANCAQSAPTIHVKTDDGTSLSGAYLLYGYTSSGGFNPVEPMTAYKPGSIIMSNQEGEFKPTSSFSLSSSVWYLLLYAPALHNAVGLPHPDNDGDFKTYKISGRSITLLDLANNPREWKMSLDTVEGQIQACIKGLGPIEGHQVTSVEDPVNVKKAFLQAYLEDRKQYESKYGVQKALFYQQDQEFLARLTKWLQEN